MDSCRRRYTRARHEAGRVSFVIGLTIAAALLAVWVDSRFESRRPESLARRAIHIVVAFLTLQAANFGSHFLIGEHSGDPRRMLVVFLLFLPTLVYTFLSGLWLMRTLAEMYSTARR
jgi:hypothetical protein